MENNNSTDFVKLLEEGKWEEALPGLRAYLTSPATDVEKGRIHVLLAEAFMKASTEMNNNESSYIKETIELLKQLDQKEQKFNDDVGLAQARSVLE